MLMLALASCQASRAQSDAIFGGPKTYVGKEVAVCGYLDIPGNLHARADGGDGGLNLNPGPFGRQLYEMGQGSRVCVFGPIAYEGCATDPNVICTDYAHDYTITVRKVL